MTLAAEASLGQACVGEIHSTKFVRLTYTFFQLPVMNCRIISAGNKWFFWMIEWFSHTLFRCVMLGLACIAETWMGYFSLLSGRLAACFFHLPLMRGSTFSQNTHTQTHAQSQSLIMAFRDWQESESQAFWLFIKECKCKSINTIPVFPPNRKQLGEVGQVAKSSRIYSVPF